MAAAAAVTVVVVVVAVVVVVVVVVYFSMVVISTGILAFYMARKSVNQNRFEVMKSKQRLRVARPQDQHDQDY